MFKKKITICLLGPMTGKTIGQVPTQAELLAKKLNSIGYRIILSSKHSNRYVRPIQMLFTLLKNRKTIDVVCLQVFGGPSLIIEYYIAKLCNLLKIPLVSHLHGGKLLEFISKNSNRYNQLFIYSTKIVVPSKFLLTGLGNYTDKIEIIPNSIEIENYHYKKRNKPKANILWMRAIEEVYDPILAIDVIYELKKFIPGVSLILAGSDRGLLKLCQEKINYYKLNKNIKIIGFIKKLQKNKLFNQSDIFLNTNIADNMPVSIIEAWAFGLPVVATNVGGIPFMLKNNFQGLLVNRNPKHIAQKINYLLSDKNLYHNVQINGRKEAQKLSTKLIIKKWQSLFSNIKL